MEVQLLLCLERCRKVEALARDPVVAGVRAQLSPRKCKAHKSTCTITTSINR